MKRRVKKSATEKSHVVGISLIIFLLDKLADAIYNAFIDGIFGRIFTAYDKELVAYNEGYITYYFRGTVKSRSIFRKVREFASGSFESSFFLGKLRSGMSALAHVPLKLYGRFFLSFGVYTLFFYFIKILLPALGTANSDHFAIGVAISLVSSPLLFSKLTLAKAVMSSKMASAIFLDCFGYREENFEARSTARHSRTGLAILLGLLAGIATLVINPLVIIAAIFSFVLIALIFNTPEIGILLSIFLLPFFSLTDHPTACIAAIVITTTVSYLIKLVRGKRVIKFELLDLLVLIFGILIFMSGKITVGGMASYWSAVLSCAMMLVYFLVKNLIRTEKWLRRCILAFVGSGAIIATYGVIQYILGFAVNDWLDTTYFADIYGRATSVFENPNYLAAYLCAVFPFALCCSVNRESAKERTLYSWASILIVACVVFTWSRAAWIAVIVCSVIFFMMRSRKTIRYIVGILFALPFVAFLISDNVVNRFMSIGDLSDSSTMYRVYTWLGSLGIVKDYFWSGVGYGAEAFAEIYPSYAYAGIEGAIHSHSLYLQILISMGIGGLLCFVTVSVFFAQKSLEYISKPYDNRTRVIASSALISIVGLLIMGSFDYIWYNYTVFFEFWLIMALGTATVKIGNREKQRSNISCNMNDCSAFVDIDCNR